MSREICNLIQGEVSSRYDASETKLVYEKFSLIGGPPTALRLQVPKYRKRAPEDFREQANASDGVVNLNYWYSRKGSVDAAREQNMDYINVGKLTLKYKNVEREIFDSMKNHENLNRNHRSDSSTEAGIPNDWFLLNCVPIDSAVSLQRVWLAEADETIMWKGDGNCDELLENMGQLLVNNPYRYPPLLHIVPEHEWDGEMGEITITAHLFLGRLFFEMISDPAIKYLMDRIEASPFTITKGPKFPESTGLYRSTASTNDSDEFKFSLVGLLYYAENSGYPVQCTQPEHLKVSLFDFQLETYQWMLDREKGPGINDYFWQKWTPSARFGIETPFYYFQLAGELRCDAPPPSCRGGLLCEEMGLGKTVEIISIVLGNPCTEASVGAGEYCEKRVNVTKFTGKTEERNLVMSRATLIVVPPMLVSQWVRELHERATGLEVIDISSCETSFKNIRVKPSKCRNDARFVPSGSPLQLKKGARVQCRFDFAEEDRWYAAQVTNVYYTSPFVDPNSKIDDNEITEVEVHGYILDELHDHDVVITSYERLRRSPSQYKRISWHRIVLDECQEVRVGGTQIASLCSDLESKYRWMVSGTPLPSSIEDLHGELKFLRVWPFCLPDSSDGFWNRCIAKPFSVFNPSALCLLQKLLNVVMFRHSKSQVKRDGSPLIKLPPRTVEWRGYTVENKWERYLYSWLETFACDVLHDLEEDENQKESILIPGEDEGDDEENDSTYGSGDDDDEDVTGVRRRRRRQAHQEKRRQKKARLDRNKKAWGLLRSFVGILSKTLTSPHSVDLLALDHVRRMLMDRSTFEQSKTRDGVPCMTVHEILQLVMSCGQGRSSGLNYETGRKMANVARTVVEEKRRDELQQLSLSELKSVLTFNELSFPTQLNGKAASRKGPYIDKIIEFEASKKSGTVENRAHSEDGHGFSILYGMMKGEFTDCPLCLGVTERPTITKCVHAYCLDCILTLLKADQEAERVSKCPVCRRSIDRGSLMEVSFEGENSGDQNDTCNTDQISTNHEDSNELPPSCDAKSKERGLIEVSDLPETASERLTSIETEFIVPRLVGKGRALSIGEVHELGSKIDIRLVPRDPRLPSIDQVALSCFRIVLMQNSSREKPVSSPLDERKRVSRKHTSRIDSLILDMQKKRSIDRFGKFVIFSQYQETLSHVRSDLEGEVEIFDEKVHYPFTCSLIDSRLDPVMKDRQLLEFNSNPDVNVLLLPTGSAAAGLTLTCASTCYLLDPMHNAADERQACSRLHRIGQPVQVSIVCFFAKGTSEERVLALRKRNRSLTEYFCSDNDSHRMNHEMRRKMKSRSNKSFSNLETNKLSFFDADALRRLYGCCQNRGGLRSHLRFKWTPNLSSFTSSSSSSSSSLLTTTSRAPVPSGGAVDDSPVVIDLT